MPGFRRDPISVLFDAPARRLLERAYAAPRGTWVRTRLADPAMRARTYAASLGIDLDGPDGTSAGGGRQAETTARTRWGRAFVRAVWYQHKWFSPRTQSGAWSKRTAARSAGGLQIEVGRHIAASPQYDPANPRAGGFPAGRAVRVRVQAGGAAKLRAVRQLPDSRRIYDDAGDPAARHSDPELRDW